MSTDERIAPFLEEWQNVVEILAAVIHVPVAVITHFSFPNVEIIRTNTGSNNPLRAGMSMELAHRYCEELAMTRQRTLIPNALESERWRDSPSAQSGFIAYLGCPIMDSDGEVFGSLCVFDTQANHFSPEMAQLMERFRALVESHLLLWQQKQRLEAQLQEIRTLRGILPMCAKCKSIRNDQGFWEQVDRYITAHSEAEFSHGLCPKCIAELYPNMQDAAEPPLSRIAPPINA